MTKESTMTGILQSYSPWRDHIGFILGDDGNRYAFFYELKADPKAKILPKMEGKACLVFDVCSGPGTLNGCQYVENIRITGYN